MKPLLGPDGLAALDAALARRALLAFDFDGTLAPIVADPDHARVPPALVPRLARLTERQRPRATGIVCVSVVSAVLHS